MYVTIHDGNFRRIYYSYTRIPGSWYALRAGSEEVKYFFADLKVLGRGSHTQFQVSKNVNFIISYFQR